MEFEYDPRGDFRSTYSRLRGGRVDLDDPYRMTPYLKKAFERMANDLLACSAWRTTPFRIAERDRLVEELNSPCSDLRQIALMEAIRSTLVILGERHVTRGMNRDLA